MPRSSGFLFFYFAFFFFFINVGTAVVVGDYVHMQFSTFGGTLSVLFLQLIGKKI